MHKILSTIEKELESYERKSQLTMSDLEKICKLTETKKNILKIEKLEGGDGYSERGDWMGEGRMYGTSYENDNSYARGRDRNARRDSRGRYSREGGNSYAGYSEKDDSGMIDRLEDMLESAGSAKEREAIKRCLKELDGE